MSHVDFKKYQHRMSLSLNIPPCALLTLRNGHVSCHYICWPHVAVTKVHVVLSNLDKQPCHPVGFKGQDPPHYLPT